MNKLALVICGFMMASSIHAQTISRLDTDINGVDWTPLFKPWENACNTSAQLDKMFDTLAPVSRDAIRYTKGKINVPHQYQSAVFQDVTMTLGSEHEEFQNAHQSKVESFSLNDTFEKDGITYNRYNYSNTYFSTSGYYYGLPVAKIGAIRGIANGYKSNYFIIDMPLDKVKNVLSAKAKYRYKYYESGDSEKHGVGIYKHEDDQNMTIIMCDYSR